MCVGRRRDAGQGGGGTTKGGRGRGGEWATLSDEPASREIDSSILCAAARGLVPS